MSGVAFASTKEPDTAKADAIIAQIAQDEKNVRLTSFTPDDAFEIGCAIRVKYESTRKLASTLKTPEEHEKHFGHTVYQGIKPTDSGITIHIETFTGHTLFTANAGDPVNKPGNWRWIQGKINVVRTLHQSSYAMGRSFSRQGRDPADFGFPFPEFAPFGGAFPVWIQGVTVAPVAVIAVSGLSQQMDHQLIVDVLKDHIGKQGQK